MNMIVWLKYLHLSLKKLYEFNSKTKNNKSDGLRKPEMCDKITATKAFELSSMEREELRNVISNKDKPTEQIKPPDPKLEKFKNFFELNNREPTEEEINTIFFQSTIQANRFQVLIWVSLRFNY